MAAANVQIFGLKNSHRTRAAERFFKERRATIQFFNRNERSMAAAEIRRFIDRFGLRDLVDRESKSWIEAGVGDFKLSDAELLDRETWLLQLLDDPDPRGSMGLGETGDGANLSW